MVMTNGMTVAIGADHGGFDLKDVLTAALKERGVKVDDVGCYDSTSTDYPDFAGEVAKRVSEGQSQQGVLICRKIQYKGTVCPEGCAGLGVEECAASGDDDVPVVLGALGDGLSFEVAEGFFADFFEYFAEGFSLAVDFFDGFVGIGDGEFDDFGEGSPDGGFP